MKNANIKVDIYSQPDIKCECGNIYFEPIAQLKKISALISPTGKATIVPIQLFKCSSCGAIIDLNDDTED